MSDRMAASRPPTAATAIPVTLPDAVAGNASPACFMTGLAVMPPMAPDPALEARHATRRDQAEHEIRDLWDAHRTDPAEIDPAACCKIQNTAYLLRREGPRVPEYFYRLRKKTTVTAISSGAASFVSGPIQDA